jgi:SAM-dependent methyltransferase
VNLRDQARRLRRVVARVPLVGGAVGASSAYARRVKAETRFFSGYRDAHELPAIYHYWSNKFLRPKLERFGHSHPEAVFAHYLSEAYVSSKHPRRTFLSVGSGPCDTEVRLAEGLIKRGHRDFTIECLELNAELLERGQALAAENGMGEHIVALRGDFNDWTPAKTYDGVIANSSLHHVQNLEGLLAGVRSSLAATGFFVTCDTIGRNGHMRWPEALSIVHEYWRELPHEYRYNHLLRRHEELYDNWDCSFESFEGIRAQDVLPLLIENFQFEFFLTFGNVIDPFIDRAFGHNFKAGNPWDAAFIDRVHARDESEMLRGAIKPTHIVAAMTTTRPARNLIEAGFPPEFCVRSPSAPPVARREPANI